VRWLYALTALGLFSSAIASPQRTLTALGVAWRRFWEVLPAFLTMLVLVSVALALLPTTVLVRYLGARGDLVGLGMASLVGSVSLLPGFIAFPLCGILRAQGVAYMVLSGFTTTLMMVGVLTFPLERVHLGTRAALLRNAAGLLIALAVALATGFAFGELP